MRSLMVSTIKSASFDDNPAISKQCFTDADNWNEWRKEESQEWNDKFDNWRKEIVKSGVTRLVMNERNQIESY